MNTINGIDVTDCTVYDFSDKCHKFYLYRNKDEARRDFETFESNSERVDEYVSELRPIENLPQDFYNSCPLRFIDKVTVDEHNNATIDSIIPQGTDIVDFDINGRKQRADFTADNDSLVDIA